MAKLDDTLKQRARALRKGMTPQERHLWYDFLKSLPVTVYRQKVIGGYIADFYVKDPKTVIEVDGSQHFEDTGLAYDQNPDACLRACGCQILRYPNNAISQNFPGVCEDILRHLRLPPPGEAGSAKGAD